MYRCRRLLFMFISAFSGLTANLFICDLADRNGGFALMSSLLVIFESCRNLLNGIKSPCDLNL